MRKPEMAPEALQLQKHHRVYAKQPETSFYGKAPTWEDIFRTIGYRTPRVGHFYFGEDELVTRLVQRLIPELHIKTSVACRGTARHRVLPTGPGTARYPWPKTILVGREDGRVHEIGPVEEMDQACKT